MPGKNPASATPSRKRRTRKLVGPDTVAIRPEMIPHVSMIRAIQRRAPTRSRIMFPGTSNSAYPRKKIPAPSPYNCELKPRSLFIVSDANAMFVRSMYATR